MFAKPRGIALDRSWVQRAPAVLMLALLAGCGPGNMSTVATQVEAETGGDQAPASPSAPQSAAASRSGAEQPGASAKPALTFTGNVDDSLASLQVKSRTLLRASIEACFGRSASTLLRTEMFAADNFVTIAEGQSFTTAGKVKFIGIDSTYMKQVRTTTTGQGQSMVTSVTFLGDQAPDVLDLEAPGLEDLSGSGRATATADTLTDRYLRSLESVAQVVAHNCNLETQWCKCDSVELATAMLRRCLPLTASESLAFQEAAEQMATQCAAGPLQTRQAIAALVGSYAFALRR